MSFQTLKQHLDSEFPEIWRQVVISDIFASCLKQVLRSKTKRDISHEELSQTIQPLFSPEERRASVSGSALRQISTAREMP